MKPTIETRVDGYIFSWDDNEIKAKINRVDVHSDGRVTGELTISRSGGAIIMPAFQHNFSTEQTRAKLAKSLTEKDSTIDWRAVIDQLSHHVQELARIGEPIQKLPTNENVKEPEFLVSPLIYKNLPNVFYGEKGVNKSTLAIFLYTCVTLPWWDNPIGLAVPDEPTPALILDWETEADIVQWSASKLQRGMDLPPFEINYRRCALSLRDDLEQIQNHIANNGIKMVIIDSLGAAAGGDLKTPEVALNFFTSLRKLKVTSLIIAQTSKNEDGKKRIFGSTYFEYYARNIWEIRKSQLCDDNSSDIALFHYGSNLSGKQKPIGISFHYNGAGISIDSMPVELAEFMEKADLQGRIIEYLINGSKSATEIAKYLQSTENSVKVTLNKLKMRGKVVNVTRGVWGLAEQREKESYES